MTQFIFRIILLGMVIGAIFPAAAHEAPSGWKYPWSCCSNKDCRMVEIDKDIKITDSGFVVVRTGEVIPFTDKRIKESGDNDWHLCQQAGDIDNGRVLCFFMPPMGM